MDKNIIKKARTVNLPIFLIAKGEQLEKTGRRYRHREHKSLVFTDNAYYWNSKGEHGNAIDFLMNYYNMGFESAVMELTNTEIKTILPQKQKKINFSFDEIIICKDMNRTIAYLNKTRTIDIKIIKKLIQEKIIFQEADTNNIIFPMYDENNKIVGAEISGTLSYKRFKGIKENSQYGYGFNIKFGTEFDYALFFESAIDLISFIEIEQIKNKNLLGCLLVSLGGLKENVVDNMLHAFKCDLRPIQGVLCVDNDKAGQAFIKRLKRQNMAYKTYLPDGAYKDWNEQLKAIKGMKE